MQVLVIHGNMEREARVENTEAQALVVSAEVGVCDGLLRKFFLDRQPHDLDEKAGREESERDFQQHEQQDERLIHVLDTICDGSDCGGELLPNQFSCSKPFSPRIY